MTDYIKVSNIKVPTIIAITAEEQQRGLMYQKSPTPIMSFIYASPRENQFWMKQTPTPLDIVFCLHNKIISICSGEPNSTKIIGNGVISDLVVEFPAGTCLANHINIGDEIELEYSEASKTKLLMLKSGILI